MIKISRKNRKKMIGMFYKISSSCESCDCQNIINTLVDFIKSNGYDINLEDLIIKKQKAIDPISGSPMSAYTLQNQLPTNGIPHTGDSHYINDDNNRDISYGLLSGVGLI